MMCKDRDTDLLLYKLGDISTLQRMSVAFHVLTCSRCRTRMGDLESASTRLRTALRPQAGAAPLTRQIAPGMRFALATLIVALFASIAFAAVRVLNPVHKPAHRSHHVRSPNDGCSPDLPTDQCR